MKSFRIVILLLGVIFSNLLFASERKFNKCTITKINNSYTIEGFTESYLSDTTMGNIILSMITLVEEKLEFTPSSLNFGWDDDYGDIYQLLDSDGNILASFINYYYPFMDDESIIDNNIPYK